MDRNKVIAGSLVPVGELRGLRASPAYRATRPNLPISAAPQEHQ